MVMKDLYRHRGDGGGVEDDENLSMQTYQSGLAQRKKADRQHPQTQ